MRIYLSQDKCLKYTTYNDKKIRLYRIVVSTLASHADNRGSNPLRVTNNGISIYPNAKLKGTQNRVPFVFVTFSWSVKRAISLYLSHYLYYAEQSKPPLQRSA